MYCIVRVLFCLFVSYVLYLGNTVFFTVPIKKDIIIIIYRILVLFRPTRKLFFFLLLVNFDSVHTNHCARGTEEKVTCIGD